MTPALTSALHSGNVVQSINDHGVASWSSARVSDSWDQKDRIDDVFVDDAGMTITLHYVGTRGRAHQVTIPAATIRAAFEYLARSREEEIGVLEATIRKLMAE